MNTATPRAQLIDDLVDAKIQRAKERLEQAGSDCLVFGAREGLALKLG